MCIKPRFQISLANGKLWCLAAYCSMTIIAGATRLQTVSVFALTSYQLLSLPGPA